MTEMIERVARAICAAEGIDPDARRRSAAAIRMMMSDGREWDNSEDLGAEWEEWVPQARAAIEAMREPTPGMRWPMSYAAWHSGSGQDIANVWRSGVDAALKEDDRG